MTQPPPPELEEVDAGNSSSSSSSTTTIEEIEEEDFTTEAASKYGIPSWKAYHDFWSSHYPNLRVSRPAEDICSYCCKFHNRFRYKQRTNQQQPFTHDDPSSFVCPLISTSGAIGGVVVNEVDNDEEDRVYTEDVDDNDTHHQGAESCNFDFCGQYSLHYYVIFMHANDACSNHTIFFCTRMHKNGIIMQ